MKKCILVIIMVISLAACTASNSSIQTAIAGTMAAGTPGPSSPDQPIVIEGEPSLTPEISSSGGDASIDTVSATPTPIIASGSNLIIIPINYKLTDQGDGWSNGEVTLAYENHVSRFVSAQELIGPFRTDSKVTIETIEGPTYPGSFTFDNISNSNYEGVFLPAGFRFLGIDGQYTTIVWKSASAATPKRVVFIDNPEINFLDLPSQQGESISFPFDSPPVPYKSIASLNNTFLVNDPGGITATFTGRCVKDTFNGDFLEVNIVNNDKFNGKTSRVIFPASRITRTGNVSYSDNVYTGASAYLLTGNVTLGPGQSETGYIRIYQPHYGAESAVIVHETADGYDLYDLDECKIK